VTIERKQGERPFRLRHALWLFAGILAVLLFVGGPGYHPPRSLAAGWDMGHVVAFSLWSYLLVTSRPIRDASLPRQWGLVLIFCLVAGSATEGIQQLVGRNAGLGDLLRDMAGGVIALSWFAPATNALPRRTRRPTRGLGLICLLVAGLPLATALSDEGIARLQFPALSGFETPFEKSRWEGNARLSVDRAVARHGKASLRVDMDTSPYPGASLVYFPRDWRRYRFLVIEVMNPSPEAIDVTCRIHDRRHEWGRSYKDRFNKVFRLRQGWNTLAIDLEEVARAPEGRTMDLGEIRQVGLFAARLPAPRTVFVDHVRLE
jgi:VanZ family protein